ncbi:MAG: NnrU family protein [Gammaproteobacteria bacterium]
MGRFLLVLAVFLIAHVIPAMPAMRRSLQARLGDGGFIAAYSALSLALFAWLIREALLAPYVPLWFAGPWVYWVALVLMPFALVLLGAGALAPNPLSIAFVTRPFNPQAPGAVAITRHPILWGLGLWGFAHVPANGHVVGLALFGSLGVFAAIGMAVVEGRRRRVLGEDRWRALAAGTSVLPFVALLTGRARWPRDPVTLIGGAAGLVAAALLLAGGHLWLFQRDPLGFL